MVTNAIDIITSEYINPFGANIDVNHLYNLSSGVAVEDTLAVEILSLEKKGSELANKFKSERMLIGNNKKRFHDPLPKNKRKTFTDSAKTCITKRGKVATTVKVSRNILGALLSFSAKASKPIYFDVALTYPLSVIPLGIALPVGTRIETPKSKLMEVKSATTEPSNPYVDNPFERENTALDLDMIATIRMMKSIPDTYEDFTWQLLKMLPKKFDRVDIVSDTYRDKSIKCRERTNRGSSSKVIIGSCKSKVPRLCKFHEQWRE